MSLSFLVQTNQTDLATDYEQFRWYISRFDILLACDNRKTDEHNIALLFALYTHRPTRRAVKLLNETASKQRVGLS